MRRFFRIFSMAAAALGVFLAAALAIAGARMPDSYSVSSRDTFSVTAMGMTAQIGTPTDRQERLAHADSFRGSSPAQSYETQLLLFQTIPLKTVRVNVVEEISVIPCGTPFGIKMFTNGVMVVGTADLETSAGTVNPAAVAGIKIGDVITEMNGIPVSQNEEIAQIVAQSGGSPIPVTFQRDQKMMQATLTPVQSLQDNAWKGGLWVRDSTAGIGTVTFYSPQTQTFGGLGHGICDRDTRDLMPMKSGEIVAVTIHDVVKGETGNAGELRGYFTSNDPIGSLSANLETGVYGSMAAAPSGEEAVPVAMKQEVRTGAAKLLATVEGDKPEWYDVEIASVDYSGASDTKNMVVKITDPALLERTGGIVQGMSGSPILQNGKLVGAVTHVFLNDPTQGYGIFAETMLQVSGQLPQPDLSKAS